MPGVQAPHCAAAVVKEGLLQAVVKRCPVGQAFDRGNFAASICRRQSGRSRRVAIQQDGAGSAIAGVASTFVPSDRVSRNTRERRREPGTHTSMARRFTENESSSAQLFVAGCCVVAMSASLRASIEGALN